ncbi:MAG: MBL fold metallo-hydrolase, partial [Pontiellaceae bacterium]|nr:MBL fold metallo-hydrolase [Pontiellaceae bacterium]
MNIKILSVGPFEVNCAVVWGAENRALIIDPGCDAGTIETVINTNGLDVAAYLLTHGHADHLCALNELHSRRPAPVYLHAADEKWAFRFQNQIPPYYAVPEKPVCHILHPENSSDWKPLTELFQGSEKTLNAGLCRVQCLETPGHTPGGVCYYFEEEKVLFSGDTLFKGTCGRSG